MYDDVSNHRLCGWPPLWKYDIFYMFISIPSKLPADCMLMFGTICNSVLNHANTLPPCGTSLVTLETYLSCLCTKVARLIIFMYIIYLFLVFSVQSCACVELIACCIETDQWILWLYLKKLIKAWTSIYSMHCFKKLFNFWAWVYYNLKGNCIIVECDWKTAGKNHAAVQGP